MQKSKDEAKAKEFAIKQLERLNQLTGLELKFEITESRIFLYNDSGPAGTWLTWSTAYKSIWSNVQIVERAYLRNTLLADTAVLTKELTELRQKLKEVQTERDVCLNAAIRFARLINVM